MTFSINTMWCHLIPFDTTALVSLVFNTFTKYSAVCRKARVLTVRRLLGQPAVSLSSCTPQTEITGNKITGFTIFFFSSLSLTSKLLLLHYYNHNTTITTVNYLLVVRACCNPLILNRLLKKLIWSVLYFSVRQLHTFWFVLSSSCSFAVVCCL